MHCLNHFILLEKQISNQYINTRDFNYCRLFGISQKIVRLFSKKWEKSGEFYVSNKNANIVLWNKRNKSRINEWAIFEFVFLIVIIGFSSLISSCSFFFFFYTTCKWIIKVVQVSTLIIHSLASGSYRSMAGLTIH